MNEIEKGVLGNVVPHLTEFSTAQSSVVLANTVFIINHIYHLSFQLMAANKTSSTQS